jgi:hypothetical protein
MPADDEQPGAAPQVLWSGVADDRPMRRLGAAVALFLVAQVGVAAWVQHHDPTRALTPDFESYEMPALALLVDGRFWTAPGSGQPEVHRTPGYPALIAATYAVFGRNPAAVVGIQLLMGCAILALVGRMAGRVNVTAAWAAVLVLGLDVVFFASTQYVLTETFFTLQLVVGVWLWLEMGRSRADGARHLGLAAVSSGVLAMMALTRPIAYYLPVLAAVGTAFVARREGVTGRRAWASAALVLLPAILLLGAWQVRNLRVSGSAEFSQTKNVALLMFRAAGVVALRDGIPLEAAQDRLLQEVRARHPDLEGIRFLDAAGAQARRVLRAEPLLAMRVAAEGVARTMLVPGENALLHVVGVDQSTGPAGDLMRLDFPTFLRTWVVGRPGEFLLFAFALAHLAVTYGLALSAVWSLPRQAAAVRTAIVAAVILIGYFVVLASGPEAYPRYRTPIAPLLAMLAGVGCQHLRSVFARGGGAEATPAACAAGARRPLGAPPGAENMR